MNAYFHQKPVMASCGGGSNMGIPDFCQAIDGNLNCQIKKPGGFVLNCGKTLPLKLKQMEYGKIEEMKNSCNRTIHANNGLHNTG